MVILTSQTKKQCKAAIHSRTSLGFSKIYSGTSAKSEIDAAKKMVRKWFGDAAAESITEVRDKSEVISLCGDYFADPQRKQVFTVWTFNPRAK